MRKINPGPFVLSSLPRRKITPRHARPGVLPSLYVAFDGDQLRFVLSSAHFDQKISQAARWGWWNAYGQHINDSTPTIKANLATMGEVDANSVEMRVSGVGLVPANYEPKSKVVTYAFTEKLSPKTYTGRSLGQSEGAKTGNPLELHC
jgi:hypothetical protein